MADLQPRSEESTHTKASTTSLSNKDKSKEPSTAHQGALTTLSTSNSLTLPALSFGPSSRRLAIAAGKAGISIADGILLANTAANPVVTAAFVMYESIQAIHDYQTGALNTLGYRTSKRDVALRVGKEVIGAGIGIGIGQAVCAALGLTAIPVVGQIVATTAISFALGFFVGALLTRYADRAFARLQIRGQYKYPSDELGAQARFEKILENLHDLSSIEACRIVQHYVDYRVASGWERLTDAEDYRASGYASHLLPTSLQHFTAVRLQRKWGFLNQRVACRKLYRALMLQHHPDRGGDPSLASQLSNDFEMYAFCRGWWSDCRSFLESAVSRDLNSVDEVMTNRRENGVLNFFRGLFFSSSKNSELQAQDLHAHNFVQVPKLVRNTNVSITRTGLPLNSEAAGSVNPCSTDGAEKMSTETNEEDDISNEDCFSVVLARLSTSLQQQSAAVSRVLSGVQRRYQQVVEAVNYTAIIRAYKNESTWKELLKLSECYSQMQTILHCSDTCMSKLGETASKTSLWSRWRKSGQNILTSEKIIQIRGECKKHLVETIFTEDIKQRLSSALELWRTGKDLVTNYLQSTKNISDITSSPRTNEESSASHIIDTLLSIQTELDNVSQGCSMEENEEEDFLFLKGSEEERSKVLAEFKVVGCTASNALGAEHAEAMKETIADLCQRYSAVWYRKQMTFQALREELRQVLAERSSYEATSAGSNDHSSLLFQNKKVLVDPKLNEMTERENVFQSQIFMLQQQLAEVDSLFEEMRIVSTRYLPECKSSLSSLPSSVMRALLYKDATASQADSSTKFEASRWALYEKERHLDFYSNVEPEPENPLEPCVPHSKNLPFTISLVVSEDHRELKTPVTVTGSVSHRLMKASRTDPLTGVIYHCWLKEYDLHSMGIVLEMENASLHKDIILAARRKIAEVLIKNELAVSEKCRGVSTLSSQELFAEPVNCCLYFQIPRDQTQQRFCSVRNIQTHIVPLGLRWLYGAIQCVLNLHTSFIAHGSIRLSNFTYDSFGNVALGFFSPPVQIASELQLQSEKVHQFSTAFIGLIKNDTTDFGIMILSEIIPYLLLSDNNIKTEISVLFKEIGERLVAKVEPSFTLSDARSFIRRCMEVPNFEAIESETAFFSVDSAFPVNWGVQTTVDHIHLEPYNHFFFLPCSRKETCLNDRKAYRNVNPPLWERYWRNRRLVRLSAPSKPPQPVSTCPLFIPCNDDMEVNERFVWCPCATIDEAWNLCFYGLPNDKKKPLYLNHPLDVDTSNCSFILVFRVILGTIILSDNSQELADKTIVIEKRVKNISLLEVIPCKPYFCYPELIVPLPSST